ncbi:hypothetical protein BSL82_05790 [Tardibacter chloracetimidivorans]|uniref:Uncharacterized protein n=1 Tax=Tardibacter chloracetimidivorans TaxID=1921510 RepID=A0A1L3ZTB4_9SPHN|nr:hypothetical protein [Tardibacter chloracetimidivorans]API58881.1 hypothetical protein BSL82_05790 [Tardibacter chloracetimidivorans]
MAAPAPVQSPLRRQRPLVDSGVVARVIWDSAWPLSERRFHAPEMWLRRQGLQLDGVPGAVDRMRWHPHCPTGPWRAGGGPDDAPSAPALLLPLEPLPGTLAGVMALYLTGDGRTLRRFAGPDGMPRPAIKTFGQQKGAGFWLTDPWAPADGPLIVGLGLRAVWLHAQALIACGQKVRAVAVPSVHELQGGAVRDAEGALPIWQPEADPGRRPLMIDRPGAVVILAPGELADIDLKVRPEQDADARVERISGAMRGWLAGHLAAAHWRASGATDVRVVQALHDPVGPGWGWSWSGEGE